MLSQHFLRMFKRTLKRHQGGQAIIILAVGFIVLLGFVGIVTDVSLLYIRYAALRRAVDSAAVAAAGQVRTDREPTAPKLAAIQFLEFHNIRTDNVYIEMCADMPPQWGAPHNPGDDTTPSEEENQLYDEVCDNQRKLVRVTAYIESPTVFMSLPPFNFDTITLSASAISETASLDVVIVMDVSESMLFETTYDTYDEELFGAGGPNDDADGERQRWSRWLPPRFGDWYKWYRDNDGGGGLVGPESALRNRFLETYTQDQFMSSFRGGYSPFNVSESDGSTVTLDFTPLEYYMDPNAGDAITIVQGSGSDVFDDLYNFTAPVQDRPDNIYQLRDDCRVRIHPYAAVLGVEPEYFDAGNIDDESTMLGQYIELADNPNTDILDPAGAGTGNGWRNVNYDMFRPAFSFYGCCNDPTAGASVDMNGNITLSGDETNWGTYDNDFTDLVCQPFKQARDATRLFLQNIDFARGDRVAFVTFDRSAYLIDPDGYSYDGFGGGSRSHMIDDFEVALEVLNRVIGVRAEPNFYYTDHNDGAPGDMIGMKPVDLWNGFSIGARSVSADTDGNGAIENNESVLVGVPLPSDYFDAPIGSLRNGYHVRDSCPFFNASLPGNYSIWASGNNPGPLYDVMTPPVGSDAGWLNHYSTVLSALGPPPTFSAVYSYENWGSCRGTNIGAGLREANNALVNPITTRQEGAVWVVILLSDGAAGATDPIPFDESSTAFDLADPYVRNPADPASTGDPSNFDPTYDPNNVADPDGAIYGAYGFCPHGTTGAPTGFTDELGAPYCLDNDPETRHSCNTDAVPIGGEGTPWEKENDTQIDGVLSQRITGNTGNTDSQCRNLYDADDYARDWADYVAMDRQLLSGEQLPTIFTIGFNLDYPVEPGAGETYCTANLTMCLGEELLRYIANVGENNEFNPDEYPNTARRDSDRGSDYGNYYNAPDESRLSQVFDEIAGKLFTRLAG